MNNLLNNYESFLKEFDLKLNDYFNSYSEYICCQKGCSHCCKKGDYPVSELELVYIMRGYAQLENDLKIIVQKNIDTIEKGSVCPFLINNCCSIYKYRPIICRVHGLAYIYRDNSVKVPYCANISLNYSQAYNNGEIFIEPIKENLDTGTVLKDFNYGIIDNLYNWIKMN